RLRPPGGPGGVKEPARVVPLHRNARHRPAEVLRDEGVVVLAEIRRADGDGEREVRRRLAAGACMVGKARAADEAARAARPGEIGDILRRLTVVRRHPHRAEAEAGEHRFEHLVAVGGLDEHPVALAEAETVAQGRRHRVDPRLHLAPGPLPLAPDEADVIRIAPGRLGEEMGEVHHPRGTGHNAPGRCRRHRADLLTWFLMAACPRCGLRAANIWANRSSTTCTSSARWPASSFWRSGCMRLSMAAIDRAPASRPSGPHTTMPMPQELAKMSPGLSAKPRTRVSATPSRIRDAGSMGHFASSTASLAASTASTSSSGRAASMASEPAPTPSGCSNPACSAWVRTG